ncbi:hypothetical protein GUI12_01395 [Anaplasmataceae bacterium AB001_6]|nr:hypothetical protein GUI12_01395 [Anaplasmataceae bacterium AB001_6]
MEDIIFHNNTETAKNRSLWRGVILQAILDASSMAKRTENVVEKKRATEWLTNMNPDFIEVCHMAGYPPEYVRKKAITFLEKK